MNSSVTLSDSSLSTLLQATYSDMLFLWVLFKIF